MAQSSGATSAGTPVGRVEDPVSRSAGTEALWAEVGIDPVELALPAGVGFTLRAYRSPAALTPSEDGEAAVGHTDDFDVAAAEVLARRRGAAADDTDTVSVDDPTADATDPASAGKSGEAEEADEEDEAVRADAEATDDTEPELPEDEDVPIFLGRGGRLYLFRSAEQLVEFIRSDAPHDLTQLDSWEDVRKRVTSGDIVPTPEDSYELDLVVDNLRGGADAWDPTIIIKSGEIARDLGYALRMPTVIGALTPGSPLDDLDEALRAAQSSGFNGFRARRRLRKFAGQQAALGWRTIVGKISAAVDWRD